MEERGKDGICFRIDKELKTSCEAKQYGMEKLSKGIMGFLVQVKIPLNKEEEKGRDQRISVLEL